MQAGREIRVMVEPGSLDDDAAVLLPPPAASYVLLAVFTDTGMDSVPSFPGEPSSPGTDPWVGQQGQPASQPASQGGG